MEPTEQDKVLYALCRPERLLDLVANFSVFDNSVRKIARHHQFFATHATAKRIHRDNEHNIRKGGVIWHTQGTGKSLTMIFIAKFLLKSVNITDSRIIIITDRIELDEQIKHAFKNCGFEPKLATSSKNLIELLRGGTSVITSVIHKFNKVFFEDFQDSNNNFFVLVDESHRTQYGDLANKMRIILPKACYIGFTGTPLLKKQKNTMEKFDGLIHAYTIKDALKDNMIVPLFYEGRDIEKCLNNEPLLNKNFDKITDGADEKTKVALKKAYSSSDALSNTENVIKAKAIDISMHYSTMFKGTGLKAMLIAPSRSIAIRFKKFLDEINQVSSEVIISSFDDREGHTDIESKNEIQEFLATQKGLKSNQIIEQFKNTDNPEILIVVSKLLTGFDAPRIAVVYICKKLKEHNLLQAIARANRLFEKNEKTKEYGYIIDYERLAVKLDDACKLYDSDELKNFDKEDLEEAIFVVNDKVEEFFSLLQEIRDIFTDVSNSSDLKQCEQYLADENIRSNFYFLLDRLKNLMSIFSNSNKLAEYFKPKELEELYSQLKNFNKLKKIVEKRYNEKTDKKIYTEQIAKLLDEHITAGDIANTETINIFDNELFGSFIKRTDITALEKANQINAEINYIISNYIRVDPALFQKFSELINNTILQHRNKSLSDNDFLSKSINIINELKKDVPSELGINKTKLAFYRKLLNFLQNQTGQDQRENTIKIALDMYKIIKNKKVIHWTRNSKTINEMKKLLDNYFFDIVKNEMRTDFNAKNLSDIIDSLINLAIEHEDE
ncbi:MAG: HsdR family type I site-specific deoxyribonuclease [Rickettsia endosymbiont of Stiretrus anchorago]|nr:HsdR family type I site-specific deoxyribonuclease [Rickettsia endosymbiont of Stiretrus anchorago]